MESADQPSQQSNSSESMSILESIVNTIIQQNNSHLSYIEQDVNDVIDEQFVIIKSLENKIKQIKKLQQRSAESEVCDTPSQNLVQLSNGEKRYEELMDDFNKTCDQITDAMSMDK